MKTHEVTLNLIRAAKPREPIGGTYDVACGDDTIAHRTFTPLRHAAEALLGQGAAKSDWLQVRHTHNDRIVLCGQLAQLTGGKKPN